MFQIVQGSSCQYINFLDPVHLIAKEFYPDGPVCCRCRKDLHYISPNPEGSAVKVHIIPCILNIHKTTDHFIPVLFHSRPQGNGHILIINGTTQSIDTGYAGYDNDIFSLRQCRRR